MSEPRWLDIDIVLDFHAEQLSLFGGADGIRDTGLLESALARPINKFAYGETDLAVLAAAYGFGIAKNHPFVDGNKRTAFLALGLFLALNGWQLETPQIDAIETMLSLARGSLDESALANWIRERIHRT